MKPILDVLHKVVVREFYLSHASFFLVVLGIGAGFMRAQEHIALASFFVSSPVWCLIPLCLSFIYALMILRFNTAILLRDENQFLFTFSLLPASSQRVPVLTVCFLEFAPAVFYGVFLLITAGSYNQWISLLAIVAALTGIVTFLTLSLYAQLRSPADRHTTWKLTRYVTTRFPKSYPFFFPEWIIRHEPLLFIGTKVFALLMLYGVSRLYLYDTYDERLITMGVLVAFMAQVNCIWHIHYFDNKTMSLLRNMPLSFGRRFVRLLVTLSVLLLPETALLISIFPAQLENWLIAPILWFGWSIPVFVYGFLHRFPLALDRLTSFTFTMFMLFMILILFAVSATILSAVIASAGIFFWYRYYYSLEFTEHSGITDDDLTI